MRARILVRRDRLLDEILQRRRHQRIRRVPFLQHDERLDDLSALRVVDTDDAAFGDGGMQQQRALDFRVRRCCSRR